MHRYKRQVKGRTAPFPVAPKIANSSWGPPSLPSGAMVLRSNINIRCPEPEIKGEIASVFSVRDTLRDLLCDREGRSQR